MNYKKLESNGVSAELEAVFQRYDPKDHDDLAATMFCTLGVGIKKIYGEAGLEKCLEEIDYHSGTVPDKEIMN